MAAKLLRHVMRLLQATLLPRTCLIRIFFFGSRTEAVARSPFLASQRRRKRRCHTARDALICMRTVPCYLLLPWCGQAVDLSLAERSPTPTVVYNANPKRRLRRMLINMM